DPDYDLAPAQPSGGSRGTLRSEGLPRVKRLPFTANEARWIRPSLKSYTRTEPLMYLGGEALEGVFKTAQRPRVVVLSTHGFFLEDQEAATARPGQADGQPARARDGKRVENPLLRCGLLLAGCNQRDREQPGGEDGILTGLEIAGTDL